MKKMKMLGTWNGVVVCGLIAGFMVAGLCGCKSEDFSGQISTQEEKSEQVTDTSKEQETMNEEDVLQKEGTKVTYNGHASITIEGKDGTVIYVDPAYAKGDYSKEADYVLVTHSHDDHELDATVERKSDHFTPEGSLVLEYGEMIVIGE